MENNNKNSLSPEEKERIKQMKKDEKEKKAFETAERKRISKEKKDAKALAKKKRHAEGKYYFWEFNKTNFSAAKILEVNVFFWVSLVFGIFAFIVPVVALSSVANFWKSILFIWPGLIILYTIINRFVESILSNTKDRNVSLFFQRIMGIGYIMIMFSYFIFLIAILANGASNSTEAAGDIINTPAIIEIQVLVVIPLIIAIVLSLLKSVGVAWYGTTKDGSDWSKYRTTSTKLRHKEKHNDIRSDENNQDHYQEQYYEE